MTGAACTFLGIVWVAILGTAAIAFFATQTAASVL